MSISRTIAIVCFISMLAAPVLAQTAPAGDLKTAGSAPQGAAPQGGASGGADMPQTKAFKTDAFVAGIDANKDGFLTKEGFKAKGLTDRMWTFCDPDKATKISKKDGRM